MREPEPESLRLRGWEVALAAGVLGLFLALRWPLLTEPGLARGWTSDAGVFGLAGKRIYQHGQIPVFFWGQNYLGTLTSILEAGIGAALMNEIVRGERGITADTALRLAERKALHKIKREITPLQVA